MSLIFIRGIPGAGKSTLAKTLRDGVGGFVDVFEADDYFIDKNTGQYIFDRTKLSEAHAACLDNARKLLKLGGRAIVSNTFTTKRELKPYFDLAKEFGIVPQVILCQGNFKSIHDVPEATIAKMKARFEYDIFELYEDKET